MTGEFDNDFTVWLVAPGTARAESRTGEFLNAMFYADDDVTALVRAFDFTKAVLDGDIKANRAEFMAAVGL